MKNKFLFGVVGHHISYSQSPQIFEVIASALNLEHSFVLHDIDPSTFDEQFPQVLASGIDGFSVTIPHKNRVVKFLDRIDPVAALLRAVNSVRIRDGQVTGFSTDGDGFAIPLEKHREELMGGKALIFGAGGAATAVIHCLHTRFGTARFYVLGRDREKLNRFASSLAQGIPEVELDTLTISEYAAVRDENYSIVVNCTPLGGWNHPNATPLPGDFVWRPGRVYYDLSYNEGNKIVAQARQRSMIAYDGSAMLVGQALRSFHLWTGYSVAFDNVYRAVFGNSGD
ncbi:MAG: shikimate dehydrogenase [Candidatus Zixiibacteriota bacterium]|nr:MAG: shikimate dehydrogenase [candidate division Zixibacteria bacterium]